jgi:hypothetical protein
MDASRARLRADTPAGATIQAMAGVVRGKLLVLTGVFRQLGHESLVAYAVTFVSTAGLPASPYFSKSFSRK